MNCFYLCVFLSVYICVTHVQVPMEERKQHQIPLVLELQAVTSLLGSMLGTELRSSGRAVHTLTMSNLASPSWLQMVSLSSHTLEFLVRIGKCPTPCWQFKAAPLGLVFSVLSLTRGPCTQSLSKEPLIHCLLLTEGEAIYWSHIQIRSEVPVGLRVQVCEGLRG